MNLLCFQWKPDLLPKTLTVQWLISASGSYSRASRNLAADIQNIDLEDIEMCRIINDRIMTVRPVQHTSFLDESTILMWHICNQHICGILRNE